MHGVRGERKQYAIHSPERLAPNLIRLYRAMVQTDSTVAAIINNETTATIDPWPGATFHAGGFAFVCTRLETVSGQDHFDLDFQGLGINDQGQLSIAANNPHLILLDGIHNGPAILAVAEFIP